MDMGVMGQRLSPGVQDGDEADPGAEALGGKRHERLGGGAHQQAVDRLLVLESDLGRRCRQGEDDVEVGNRKQLGLTSGEPFGPRPSLTLSAMTVAARVIGDAGEPAIVAALDMTAERRRAAGRDRSDHAPLDPSEVSGVRPLVSLAVAAEDVGQVERRPRRHRLFRRRHLKRQPIQRALGPGDQLRRDTRIARRRRQILVSDVLQKHGHIVGMTGDGVNDAPALKKADCGFAVSGATDAARAAASIVLVAPGLSVIIDAIKESRKIFQRMNSYAIYRIAETLRVLLFMTLAIVIFNFYPLTAIMIVMLALLNDGAILSIAYDNVTYRNQPEAWNMRLVLGIATVLGLVGPIAAFGLFYLGDRIFHLGHPELQTMMYLMLSVAGHLTIFQTRTRGPWWSTRPAWILLAAVFGTQALATLISVYGAWLVTPLGWKYAGIVWATPSPGSS